MTQRILAWEEPPLVRLLSEHFSEQEVRELMQGVVAPAAGIWNRAIHDPLRPFLGRPGKEFRARLVEACYRLGGGKGSTPSRLPLLLEVLHAGSLVVDDIQDDAKMRRGSPALHVQYGVPVALNAGNWLYFWAFSWVEHLGLGPLQELYAYRWLSKGLLRCHHGQGLDLTANSAKEAQGDVQNTVSATTALKTGGLFELAAGLGAIAAGASRERVRVLADFGRDLGTGLQMLDDLGGIANPGRHQKGEEDLVNGRLTWPWSWAAALVSPGEYAALCAQSAQVQAGTLAPKVLAHRLKARTSDYGTTQVHAHLAKALAALTESVGDGPVVRQLAGEVRRLEESYE